MRWPQSKITTEDHHRARGSRGSLDGDQLVDLQHNSAPLANNLLEIQSSKDATGLRRWCRACSWHGWWVCHSTQLQR
jgi:hypothetical protein